MDLYLLAKISPTVKLDTTQTIGVIISGLVVVFLVLLILVGFVSLFSTFFKKKKNAPANQNSTVKSMPEKSRAVSPSVPEVLSENADSDENEIIAVISAVIAQMSEADGKNYRIKSVKAKNSRQNGRPVWASEGLRQNTKPF